MHKITVFLIDILLGCLQLEASDRHDQELYYQHDFFQYYITEMQKEADAIQNIKNKTSQPFYKAQQYCENLALHPIDPYQSILLNYYVSNVNTWHVRLRGERDFSNFPGFPELLHEVNKYLAQYKINYCAKEEDLPFLLSKAVLAASVGKLWKVRPIFEIENRHTLQQELNCLLRPVVACDEVINSNNLYSSIYKLFCYLKTKWDYSHFKLHSFNDLKWREQYGYNQMLGFNIQNAGKDVVLQVLQKQLNSGIPVTELCEKADIWSNLLSGEKSIFDLDANNQKLFASFDRNQFKPEAVDSMLLTTILGNEFPQIDPLDLDESTQLGGKTVNSLYDNADFAMAGLLPLLSRGLVTEPRVELGIMLKNTNWMDGKTLYTSDEVGDLSKVSRLAQSHLGYNLIGYNFVKQDEEFKFAALEGVTCDFHPFLPLYSVLGVIEDDQRCYEYFPQTCVERYIKAEAQARIDDGINAAIKKILKKNDTLPFWTLKKELLQQLLNWQRRNTTEEIDDFKNQMTKKYNQELFQTCFGMMSNKEIMIYKRMLAYQAMPKIREESIKGSIFQEAFELVSNPLFQANHHNAFCFKTLSYQDENFIYRP